MAKLFDHQHFIDYLNKGSTEVDGYLQSGSAALIWSLFDIQDELNITGNVAEIGVYHGKLFIFLCHALNQGERAYAIDVFDSEPEIQGIQTQDDKDLFSAKNLIANLAAQGIGDEVVKIITANSGKLAVPELRDKLDGDQVRLFSIDGDHSRDGVRHDLNLAAETTRETGIIIVDDLFNSLCPSNTEGIIDFFREDNSAWTPIAIAASNGPIKTGAAKLFVAHKSRAMIYKAYLRLLNRDDFKIADTFLGEENVLIFDFQSHPVKQPLDSRVRLSVARFLEQQ